MCSAIHTRPLSTCWWIATHSSKIGVERLAGEDALQRRAQLRLPRCAQAVVLQPLEEAALRVGTCNAVRRRRHIEVGEPVLPQAAHLAQQLQRLLHPVLEQFGRCDVARIVALAERQPAFEEEGLERIDQRQLVAQAELDVQALDAIGVLTHARQRDHHVLVDLEGIGVAADGRGALAVEPELLARVRTDRDEALARRGRWPAAPPRS